MGDTLALRMALASNKGAKETSNLMPPKTDSLILLRVRLPWFRIERVTFYILKTILSTILGGFMLENLILFFIMLTCIVMRLLALGIQLISKCLKRKFQSIK
jgi:Ca2+-dependent lipid-binding protein